MANLLALAHQQKPLVGLRSGPNGSLDIEKQTHDILEQCSNISQAFIAMKPPKLVAKTKNICLIHGDPVPGNIVLTDKNPVLIDWQCPANGDPVEDLALFLSPTMQLLYRGAPLSASEEQDFLGAYPNAEIVRRYHLLKPWFNWRMAAYCLWQMEQDNDDYTAGFQLECDQLSALPT